MSHDRRPAYADLLGALLSLRPDAASERFDALLAELLASGQLDPADARELRWWQRESVRAVGDFLAETGPDLLAGLESSQRQADDAVSAAALAWDLASSPPLTAADEGDGARPGLSGPGARARARAGTRHPEEGLDLPGRYGWAAEEDPDGPYEPVEPRPAPEPTADRPAGARLRKAAGRARRTEEGEQGGPRAQATGNGEALTDEPSTVIDLRSRPRGGGPEDPPSARTTDTVAPPGLSAPTPVASPRRRLLLSTQPLTTRADTW